MSSHLRLGVESALPSPAPKARGLAVSANYSRMNIEIDLRLVDASSAISSRSFQRRAYRVSVAQGLHEVESWPDGRSNAGRPNRPRVSGLGCKALRLICRGKFSPGKCKARRHRSAAPSVIAELR